MVTSRVAAGVPAGGQFAASARSEAGVSITAGQSHLDGMTPLIDHPEWPAVTDLDGVTAINDEWDTEADLYYRPELKNSQFTLVSDFDLSRGASAAEPWQYTANTNWGEDEDGEAEEHMLRYEYLADAIESDPDDVPPIVVVIADDGNVQILDGNHRAGLALSRGRNSFPAYIARDPGGY